MTQILPYLGAGLALLGLLFGAGQKWGELNQRVTALEHKETYIHGSFVLPTEGSHAP